MCGDPFYSGDVEPSRLVAIDPMPTGFSAGVSVLRRTDPMCCAKPHALERFHSPVGSEIDSRRATGPQARAKQPRTARPSSPASGTLNVVTRAVDRDAQQWGDSIPETYCAQLFVDVNLSPPRRFSTRSLGRWDLVIQLSKIGFS